MSCVEPFNPGDSSTHANEHEQADGSEHDNYKQVHMHASPPESRIHIMTTHDEQHIGTEIGRWATERNSNTKALAVSLTS